MAIFTGVLQKNSIVNSDINVSASIAPTKLGLIDRVFGIPLNQLLRADTLQPLPASATGTVLCLKQGSVWGTNAASIQTGNLQGTTTTQYGMLPFILPAHYEPGEAVSVVLTGGMNTTVSDDTAEVDVECYLADDAGAFNGIDLCSTAAQDINSLSASDKTFQLDPTNMVAGSQLWLRVAITVVDGSTATNVIGQLLKIAMNCRCRG